MGQVPGPLLCSQERSFHPLGVTLPSAVSLTSTGSLHRLLIKHECAWGMTSFSIFLFILSKQKSKALKNAEIQLKLIVPTAPKLRGTIDWITLGVNQRDAQTHSCNGTSAPTSYSEVNCTVAMHQQWSKFNTSDALPASLLKGHWWSSFSVWSVKTWSQRLLQNNLLDWLYLLSYAMRGLIHVFLTPIPLKHQFSSCLLSVWICWVRVVKNAVCQQWPDTRSVCLRESPSASESLFAFVLLITAAAPQTRFFVGFRQMLNKVSPRESGRYEMC